MQGPSQPWPRTPGFWCRCHSSPEHLVQQPLRLPRHCRAQGPQLRYSDSKQHYLVHVRWWHIHSLQQLVLHTICNSSVLLALQVPSTDPQQAADRQTQTSGGSRASSAATPSLQVMAAGMLSCDCQLMAAMALAGLLH